MLDKTWSIGVADDALNPKSVRTLHFKEGTSLDVAIGDLFETVEDRRGSALAIGGHMVPETMWSFVKPKPNSIATLIVYPGSRGVVALTAAIAATVVVAVLAPYLLPFVGPIAAGAIAGTAGALTAFAITYAGSALFGYDKVKKQDEEAETFSLTNARNRAIPYGAVPVVLGTHKMVPPYIGQPYTDSAGQNQFLRFAVTWGYGPIEVDDIKIGNSLITNYERVQESHDFEGRKNRVGFYPKDVDQVNPALPLDTDTSYTAAQTTPVDTEEISVTLLFPGGLYSLSKKKGTRKNESVDVIGQYRTTSPVGAWTTFFERTITSRVNKPLRFTEEIADLDPDQYDVQVAFASTPGDGQRDFNDCVFESLRSISYRNPVDDDFEITKSGYRIKANDQLNGVVNELNGIVSTKIPTWNGSAWTTQSWNSGTQSYDGVSTSSNPAAIYRYIHLGLAGGEVLTSASMDDDGLGAWYEFCEDEGLTYNRVINFRTTIDEIRREVAAAGSASPDFVDGKWGVLIDQPKTTVVQHFTPRNTNSFVGMVNFAEVPHALRCRFANKRNDYIDDEVVVYDDGYTEETATKFQVVEFPGHTTARMNRKTAKRFLRSSRLRPEVFTFDTDFENLVATRGDLVRLTHDAALIGQQSGRITAIDGNTITLDEPITMETGVSYGMRVRTQTNTSEAVTVTLDVGTTSTIIIPSTTENDASIALMNVGDLFMFGVRNEESIECVISEIEHMDNLRATITCVPYSDDVYALPSDEVGDYVSTIQLPVSKSFRGPPPPKITTVVSGENELNKTASGVPLAGMVVFYDPGLESGSGNSRTLPTEFVQLRYRQYQGTQVYDSGGTLISDDPGGWDYTAQVPVDSTWTTITDVITNETYELQIRAISEGGGTSEWVQFEGNHTVLANNGPPSQVNNLYLSTIGDLAYLIWDYEDEPADLRSFEIRYSTSLNATNWNTMMVVGNNIERETRSFTVPNREGTYAIKGVDVVSQKSQVATFVNTTKTDNDPNNTVASGTLDPTWTGTKTNTVVNTTPDPDELELDNTAGVYDPLGYYEFGAEDLGAVYTSTVNIAFAMGDSQDLDTMDKWTILNNVLTLDGADSVSDDVSVVAQISYSEDDVAVGSATFTDWQTFISGEYTARHVKFRLVLTTDDTTITPQVSQLSYEILMKDYTQTGTSTSSSGGDVSVTFSPDFYTAGADEGLKSVMVNIDNPSASGEYVTVPSQTNTGFTVGTYDSGNTRTARAFTWTAVGYGREKGT